MAQDKNKNLPRQDTFADTYVYLLLLLTNSIKIPTNRDIRNLIEQIVVTGRLCIHLLHIHVTLRFDCRHDDDARGWVSRRYKVQQQLLVLLDEEL